MEQNTVYNREKRIKFVLYTEISEMINYFTAINCLFPRTRFFILVGRNS